MKLTKSQQNELEVWKYFIPTTVKWKEQSDDQIKKFFEWSERGLHRDKEYGDDSYFNALREGKRWAGIHMGMYEDSVLEGTIPYADLLQDIPVQVKDFMKKEMFKGKDAELIEKVYQEIIN